MENRDSSVASEAGNTLLFLVVVLAFGLLSYGAYAFLHKKTVSEIDSAVETATSTADVVVPEQTGPGFVVDELNASSTVKFPLTIKGSVNGKGWGAFEGQMGTVSILDENKKPVLDPTPLKAVGEWMQIPAYWQVTLGDEKLQKTLSGKTITLHFVAENTKGDEEPPTFDLNMRVEK